MATDIVSSGDDRWPSLPGVTPATGIEAAPTPERELNIDIWPDHFAFYDGTADQLQAEGLIPAGFEWPRGRDSKDWEDGKFKYGLRRMRPDGHNGPMRSWLELDNWRLRVSVVGRDRHWYARRDTLSARPRHCAPLPTSKRPWASGSIGMPSIASAVRAGAARRTIMATKKPKTEATSGGVAGSMRVETVGRRYTKTERTEYATEFGPIRFDQIDPDASFSVARLKASASAALAQAGYLASDLYGDDGTCWAIEQVIYADAKGADSLEGLAATTLRHCRELELLAETMPADQWKAAAASAYALGRMVVLQRAYGVGNEARRINATAERPSRRTTDHDEIEREFARLVRGGHTESEARGILRIRGLGSAATIYRVTTKKAVR